MPKPAPTPVRTTPCPLCGYHAPEEVCPHCGGSSQLKSLAQPLRGPARGLVDGLLAVPMGLWILLTTRRVKRWLLPPLVVTSTVLVVALWTVFGWFDRLLDSVLPGEVALDGSREWLEGLGGWDWLQSVLAAALVAAEWVLNQGYQMLTAQPLKWLAYFFLGSLVAWYAFSLLYEALAGPFLDEVHGRLEKGWFGADPRSRLQRPNDIPEERTWRRTMQASVGSAALILGAAVTPGVPFWLGLVAAPLAFVAASLLDREYGAWLRWMVALEGRATWVSLQAAAITGVLLVMALPLYFIPFGIGYVLFAGVTGFATAVGLLDIPFERRGIRLRQRLRFLLRNLLPMLGFGVVSGVLLAIPVAGPVLMVPAASVGGLWLLCRLDKSSLRPTPPAGAAAAEPTDGPGTGPPAEPELQGERRVP
ncbi:MAG: EI24 domain-containing protein [Planctomycetota bacterium]